MPKIFLSYRREDSSWAAHQLATTLKQHCAENDRVFIDVDDIPAGTGYVKHLEDQVEQCDYLLAIIGPNWLYATAPRSNGRRRLEDPLDWVRVEIAAALKRDIPVVPVLLDDTDLPSPADLPEPLQDLPGRQAERLRVLTFDADAIRLARKLGLAFAHPRVEAPPSPPPVPPPPIKRNDGIFFLLRLGPLQLALSVASAFAVAAALAITLQTSLPPQAAARSPTEAEQAFASVLVQVAELRDRAPQATFAATSAVVPFGFEMSETESGQVLRYNDVLANELSSRLALATVLLGYAVMNPKDSPADPAVGRQTYAAGCAAVDAGYDWPLVAKQWDEWDRLAPPVDVPSSAAIRDEIKNAFIRCTFGRKGVLPLYGATSPVVGVSARLTSSWGYRSDPFTNRTAFHEGLDLAAAFGSPILAPKEGIVIFAGVKDGYGRVVELDLGEGYKMRFGYLNSISVKVDERVRAGQKIGTMGSTGRSTGPHLHFEVYFGGRSYDPNKVQGLRLYEPEVTSPTKSLQ